MHPTQTQTRTKKVGGNQHVTNKVLGSCSFNEQKMSCREGLRNKRANCWCVSGAGGNTPTGAAGGTNVFARAVHHLCPSDPPLQPQVTLVALCDPFLPDLADASANPRWISPRRCDPCKTITLCGVSVCNSGQTALWASRGPSKLHDVHRWLQDTPAHNTVSGPPA